MNESDKQNDNGQGRIQMADYILRTNAVKLYIIGCLVSALCGVLLGWQLNEVLK